MVYDATQASRYNADCEHMLPPSEARLWLAEMAELDACQPRGRVLDIGAGTGLLTSALKSDGFSVTGLEPSREMIRQGVGSDVNLDAGDFVVGDAADSTLFGSSSFDWIVSRQVLCHLTNPSDAFSIWHTWLRPGGKLMLVDGLWPIASWSNASLRSRPLASLTTAAPVAEIIERVGFIVIKAGPFVALDEARQVLWPNSKARYLVTAVRP